jgi:F0F1-type ATP synthase membrane subunit b/b'
MNNWKAFLIGFVVVYLIAGISINAVLGPPGMSKEFLEKYKTEYGRYTEVKKKDEYKLWNERPNLHPLDQALADDIAFIETNPEFHKEEKRRNQYDLLFDFFNAGMLIILIVRFSRKPVAALLDGMVAQVQTELNKAEGALRESKQQMSDAETKMNDLEKEEAKLAAQTINRISKADEANRMQNGQILSVLNRETQDRMKHEQTLARQAIKNELVEKVIEELAEHARTGSGLIQQEALLNQFVQQVEKP